MIKAPCEFCVLVLISLILVNSFCQEVENSEQNGRPLFKSVESIQKYAEQGINLFENFLISPKEIEDQGQNNLQFSLCSKKARQSCIQSAVEILSQCKDDDSEKCWREITLVYPKCLKCFCPYILAKTCQATNFILWLAHKKADHDGCWNILQQESLNYAGCDWCMCMAKKHGYETYFQCENQLKQKIKLAPKYILASIKNK